MRTGHPCHVARSKNPFLESPCNQSVLARPLSRLRMHRVTVRYLCATARWHKLLLNQVQSCLAPSRASECTPARIIRPLGTSVRSRDSTSFSRTKLYNWRAPACSESCIRTSPISGYYGPPITSRARASRLHDRAVLLQLKTAPRPFFFLIPINTLPILSIPKHHHSVNSHTPPLNPCFCVISLALHRRVSSLFLRYTRINMVNLLLCMLV
ncbi:hypothetical protein PIB30_054441 [Stylosanthes scabra]|uniref:Uncharacterized protein n=1 Tax=Stylosanthes scabra TaxID=79078 RepID=A0ABU6SJC5_9FABA|nr:hypothetical protein [Stylosanthes scabra]